MRLRKSKKRPILPILPVKVKGLENGVEQRFLHFWRCHKISVSTVGQEHYTKVLLKELCHG